jgi:SpoVK/Ycf46/Vps4 family AAA+-type ATPase
MKPAFIDQIEEAFAVNQHCILNFNTNDRFYWQEKEIGPVYLNYFLAQYFRGLGYRVAEYAPALGLSELDPNGNNQKKSPFQHLSGQQDPVVIINKIISTLKDQEEKRIFIVHYGGHLAPRESIGVSASTAPGQVHAIELLHRISYDDSIAKAKSRIIIVNYSDPMAELIVRADGYKSIRINLPSHDERLSFIEFLQRLSKKKPKYGKLQKDISANELATITAGMPLIKIESLYLSAGYNKKNITRKKIKESKSESIAQLAQDLLEVSEPTTSFKDVAGMKPVVDFFKLLVAQIKAAQAGVPQTVLLHGVPGCGKTHIIQAIAHALGWPLIQLRQVRGPYVGQSEQQLELVITIVEQLKPVLLLFDEIDQLIGQRGTGGSGDSGTSERMLARLFNWLGGMENRGKILYIGTSNRPDILDAALLDRFRVSIPVLNPSKQDLSELVPIFMQRFDRRFENGISIIEVAGTLSELQPSGRSLQEIIIQAGFIADNDSGKVGSPIGDQHLLKACNDYLPIEDPLEMEFIKLTSLSMCSSNTYLPWMGIDGLRADAQIPKDLISDEIVDQKSGRLNKTNLHKKLNELTSARQISRAMR